MKLDDLFFYVTILIFFYTLVNETGTLNNLYKKTLITDNIKEITKKIKYRIIIPKGKLSKEITLNTTDKLYIFSRKYLAKNIKGKYTIDKITKCETGNHNILNIYIQLNNINYIIMILYINEKEFYLVKVNENNKLIGNKTKKYYPINSIEYPKKYRKSKYYNKWIV